MFIPNFINSLQQAPRDNPWPKWLTNQKYKTYFQKQSNYFMGIENKITYGLKVMMCKKWPKNHVDLKDDTYETLVLVHSRE